MAAIRLHDDERRWLVELMISDPSMPYKDAQARFNEQFAGAMLPGEQDPRPERGINTFRNEFATNNVIREVKGLEPLAPKKDTSRGIGRDIWEASKKTIKKLETLKATRSFSTQAGRGDDVSTIHERVKAASTPGGSSPRRTFFDPVWDAAASNPPPALEPPFDPFTSSTNTTLTNQPIPFSSSTSQEPRFRLPTTDGVLRMGAGDSQMQRLVSLQADLDACYARDTLDRNNAAAKVGILKEMQMVIGKMDERPGNQVWAVQWLAERKIDLREALEAAKKRWEAAKVVGG